MTGGPTVRAVVAYAQQLRERAEERMRQDPWARPYYPTTASARRLSSRLGPARALERLRELALEAERRDRERDARSREAAARLAARHANSDAQLARRRERMTPGQRIDRALAELAVISSVPAARIGGDVVHGGEADQVPRRTGDPAGRARAIALRAACEIERELDEARRRDLRRAA